MKTLLIGFMVLTTSSVFAQYTQVGATTSTLIRNKGTMYGVTAKYVASSGITIPVTIQYGEGLKNYVIGLGYTQKYLDKKISNTIGLGISNLQFNDQYQVVEKDRNRISLLLQEEIQYAVNDWLSLGVHVNLNMFQVMRRYKTGAVNGINNDGGPEKYGEDYNFNQQTQKYTNNRGQEVEVHWKSRDEHAKVIESASKSSMSNFGVSIKLTIPR